MVVPTKVFVGNLPEDCPKETLQKELENYGKVVEFDVVLNYAFAHFKIMDDAKDAVTGLNGKEFMGKKLRVELSTSRVRQKPGMGGTKECFRCGGQGHWSKACPVYPDEEEEYGRSSYRHDRRATYDRDPYSSYYDGHYASAAPVDRYRPYPSLYDRRRLPPPPPRDLYARDPYTRPPPDYYSRSLPALPRDPYDLYYERAYGRPPMVPRSADRESSSSRPMPQPY